MAFSCSVRDGVDMLPRLTELIIDDVPNLKLPRLPSVEHLDAWNMKDGASFMEEVVGNMHCLKTLNISYFEKVKVIPDQLSRLGALQELYISYCDELECFSEDALQGLTSLRSLEISFCSKLKSLSEGVRHLACLERFYVNYCPELVDLPNNMKQLTALRKVTISGSKLLPEGLQHIPSLQTLEINECESTSLPDWLGDMTSLRRLHIKFCWELRSLPSNIQRLTNLRELSIEYCPMLEKRCKKEKGEDWQYIAHIPIVDVVSYSSSSSLTKDNFSDKIRLTLKNLQTWSTRMFATLFATNALPHDVNLGDEFDRMVEEEDR